MRNFVVGLVMTALIVSFAGCATINVPDKIDIGSGGGSQKVDSSRVPETRNHEECRAELIRAYGYIRNLERKNAKLEKDKSELKTKVSELKKQLKRYKD
jgi:hypothetical protein